MKRISAALRNSTRRQAFPLTAFIWTLTIWTHILAKGHHYIDIALDELVFFIRSNKAIPFGKPSANVGEIDLSSLELIGFPNSTYRLYSDNGFSPVPEDRLTVTEYQK